MSASAVAESDDYANALTGDWSGARQQLHERGVDFDAGYVGELARNVSGGERHAYAYADEIHVAADFDFDKLFGWTGGSAHINVISRNGMAQPLEVRAGLNALLPTQEIYGGGRVTRLYNLYLEQQLWNDTVDLKLGRMGLSVDFFQFSCDFQDLSFCGTLPSWITHDLNDWPLSQLGGVIGIQPSPTWYFKVGGFKVNPNNAATSNAWRMFPKGENTGTLVIAETGLHTHLAGISADSPMEGTWSIGAWRNTTEYPDLLQDVNGVGLLFSHSESGVYALAQQQVTQNAAGGGLTLFANFVKAESHIDLIDRMVSVGIFLKAPFASRPQDQINFAIGRNYVSDDAVQAERLAAEGHVPALRDQDVIEVNYAAQLYRGVLLMPNVQYIRHVSGSDGDGNAVVLGLRAAITF